MHESEYSIVIKDVGPVTEFTLPIAAGVTVLTGDNEVGKTTCILATAALAGRKDTDLAPRDGTKAGMVRGLGTILSISKRTTKTGELEVDSVEDRLDLAALVDPGLKDGAAANRRRIRALLSLSGTKLDLKDFAELLPENMSEELVAADADDDPVEMAGKIKRRWEKKARENEEKASQWEGKAIGLRDRLKDQDLEVESDQAKLQRRLLDATAAESRLREQQRGAQAKGASIEEAKRKIVEIESSGSGKVQAAERALEESENAVQAANRAKADADGLVVSANARVEEFRRQLAMAEQASSEARNVARAAANDCQMREAQHEAAQAVLNNARERLGDLGQLRSLAASAAPEGPDALDLEAAKEECDAAAAAVERGAIVRDLLQAKDQLKDVVAKQTAHVRTAEIFRAGARGTDEVLSNAGDCETLKVIEGELTYVEAKRSEAFARLSDGKRWQVGITEVARAIRKTRGGNRLCILPIQQQAFEGMVDHNRKTVYDTAIACNVCIVTAEKGSDGQALESYEWKPKA